MIFLCFVTKYEPSSALLCCGVCSFPNVIRVVLARLRTRVAGDLVLGGGGLGWK